VAIGGAAVPQCLYASRPWFIDISRHPHAIAGWYESGAYLWCKTVQRIASRVTSRKRLLLRPVYTREDISLCYKEHSRDLSPWSIKKAKAIRVTGRGDPQGCEMSRLPHFLDYRLTGGGEVVRPTRRPLFTPQEDSWYSFLLEAESTPRAIMRLEELGQLKIHWPDGEWNPRPFAL
jgi:hypothetical protein